MYPSPQHPIKSSCSSSSSITELLAALCDSSLAGVSWKRRALGGISREDFRRALKKRAYGALLSKLFQDGTKAPASGLMTNSPPRNQVLMICFDLRVAGCREEAEKLEEQLEKLPEGASSGLSEVDAVLKLLVHLAGSTPPPSSSFSRDYMRRERPVLRRPPPWGYQSEELQRLEARAWGLVCGEEWASLESVCVTQRVMESQPGTGLLALRTKMDTEERFERETRLTLFGALQHTRTSDLDIRLDLPPVPSNVDLTGLAIRVPSCLDQSEDEGFQSASNMTPDSQSEPSPSPEVDLWEALRTFEPGVRCCWESIGWPPGRKESLYLSESGREAFDQIYRLWEGEMRVVSTSAPSPLLPLPIDSQRLLVGDLLNVLIGVASTTFPLNKAFTGGLRKYLHYYRACVLSTPPTLSLMTIGFLFRKVGQQLRYLSELCRVDGPLGGDQAAFPVGVKLLSHLYNEAQNNCSNENYPVLLSLLKSSCEPYTRFVSDWVYSGVFRDVYREFMIQVNEEFLGVRDNHFWVHGYTLISKDVEECVPIFLRHIANDVYVCGKTINLLRICCPQHYICLSELPVPRIAVTFSLQEVEQIERDCAVYRGRMERIAKHSAISREVQAQRAEEARQELINQVTASAAKTLESIRGRQVSQRLAEEAKKRERLEDLKHHLEQEQEWRSSAKKKQEDDDFSFARELRDREKRLQALGEQLEQRARKELIAQFSRLSEEAARRERRALWRVQRMRFDAARSDFFMRDKQQLKAILDKYPLGQEGCPASPAQHTSLPDTLTQELLKTKQEEFQESETSHTVVNTATYISGDFLPVPDAASRGMGSDLPEACPAAQLIDYDFSTPFSPLEGITSHPKPRCDVTQNHPSFSHFPMGENVPLVPDSLPKASPFGHTFKSSSLIGQYTPEEAQHASKTGATGVPCEGATQLREGDGSVLPEKENGTHEGGVDKDALLQQNLDGVRKLSNCNRGKSPLSDYNVEKSNMAAPLSPMKVAHPSDSHINIGEHVPDVQALLPSSNIHGHASDAHIKVGENVSDFVAPIPFRNLHGHASDAHIKVGENISEVVAPLPSPSVHGHSSDANIRVGEFVSNVPEARPRWSKHGHASDCTLLPGCMVSGSEPLSASLPGSAYGHASDSTLVTGCVVTQEEVKRSPLPGSAHGHSSDSSLGVGCVVTQSDPPPPSLPGSQYGHSSDSTLGVGCVVLGAEPQVAPLPGSEYGHSSHSSLGAGCVVGGTADDRKDAQVWESETRQQQQQAEGAGLDWSPGEKLEQEYLLALSAGYQVEHYEDCYNLMASSPECQLLKHVTRTPWGLPVEPGFRQATDTTAVQLSEMVSLPVLIKHSVTAPLITHVSLVNKAVVDYFFVELGVERHFEALRHFLLMEDGEFAQSLSDRLFEKLGSGQTPGELLTPLVLNSILSKALQYSLHGDTPLAANFTFALRFLPDTFHPHAPDSLNCLELRYKVDWPLNIVITDSCMNQYNRLFSFQLQLKHMVWSLTDVWFHLKRTALVKGAGRSVQFRQLQLYRHEMQHFVKVIQGYIANQILQVSWSEFTAKVAAASDLDAIHRTHADYLNRAIFRALLTKKAAPVMNIIHSIFSFILKFRAQLIAQPWCSQQGEAVHPGFVAMQQSYNTFKYYSHFLFKVVTKLVNRGYQPHLEDFLLRINFNNYYKDS
ncbi:gamma-tubulin complex component 6 isoform X2 [Dunckerocampus dactyliophorus]|uniref:gamma-tubulin complex component 6 isoform X2 n=1 Tax=Dunckerocampus dactyliophorus TaxID=161453 RepID=UPI0024053884|nr:gamma-tubulin complex component 6 isoform X2 [Dunckerocampus dactyliophorus]